MRQIALEPIPHGSLVHCPEQCKNSARQNVLLGQRGTIIDNRARSGCEGGVGRYGAASRGSAHAVAAAQSRGIDAYRYRANDRVGCLRDPGTPQSARLAHLWRA
jgi:hypothetical protein